MKNKVEKDYLLTPSFYNNEEVFSKFLGNANYYINMQNILNKLIKLTKSESILELGCALGSTTIKLAKDNASVRFTGIDIRENIIDKANRNKESEKVNNAVFKKDDILNISNIYNDEDFTFFLFAFHHITDPLDNKIQFLKAFFNIAKNGSYLCITETFLPEDSSKENILNLFEKRRKEGFLSTFWNVLEGVDDLSIQSALEIANYCGDNEYGAGELVAKRDNEYLVTKKWLQQIAVDIGYEIILDKDIDSIGDSLFLFRVHK